MCMRVTKSDPDRLAFIREGLAYIYAKRLMSTKLTAVFHCADSVCGTRRFAPQTVLDRAHSKRRFAKCSSLIVLRRYIQALPE